ncbi:MAG: PP2C family protein-serine/threonine phosphatase [Polyangiaceae bacterium]
MRLSDAADDLDVEGAVRLIKEGLDLAARFEARGLAWRPTPSDFALDDAGKLTLVERRGVFPLEYPERFNVDPLLVALGANLVPNPLGVAPPSLVRMLLPQKSSAKNARGVDDARKAIDAIDLKPPPATSSAAMSDAGLWRDHNDDVASTIDGGTRGNAIWHALVVCDGVSSVPHAASAAAVAARAARDEIARSADTAEAQHVVAFGVKAADIAVRKLASEVDSALGTTIVCAFIRGDEVAVGWVGDSRAYLVTEDGEELLTTDHAVERELTSCLGMVDSEGGDVSVGAEVVSRRIGREGTVVACTDGLWNYFPSASAVAHLVRNMHNTHKNAAICARFLINSALASGGGDNVGVAVHRRGG